MKYYISERAYLAVPLFFGLLALFSSCREFIEPSLEHKTIRAIAPAEGVETNSYQLTFWWEQHPDALRYRLQLVLPSFAAAEKMVLDTLVEGDKFIYTVDPGSYQWRVRAENGSSRTAFVSQSFVVHPSSLSDQMLQLLHPVGQVHTNSATLSAGWLRLYGATGYRLQLDRNNFADEDKLDVNVFTDNLSYQLQLPQEGNFQLRVRAESATEQSKWSTVRNVIYDATLPAQVVLHTPASGQTLAKPVALGWNTVPDAVQYELGIYKSDRVTPFSSIFPLLLSTNTYAFNLGENGENLAWRVRAIDRAGNRGDWSSFFTFSLQ